ncbi:MAG TPA: GNVR domain-containing protein [Terriglobales bacterium]|jgi:uncharacterized protein involved in exopolysaccharide biosynthesis
MDRMRNATARTQQTSPALTPVESPYDREFVSGRPSSTLNYAIILWRHRTTLAKIVAVGTMLTLLIALLIPTKYESSTRLMAPDMRSGSQFAMMAGLLAKAGGMGGGALTSNLLGGMNNAGDMFVGVLRSRTIASNLVRQFDLKKVYGVRKDWGAQENLADRTEISQDRKSGIITIRVEDHVPQRAADLAHAYVDQLNWLLVEVNTSSAHRERLFLEERLNVVKKELDSATKQLSEFSVKNTTIDPKEQGHAMVEAAVSLQGELIATQTELRGLEQIYTDNNVRVRSLRARIAELRSQIDKLRGPDPNQPEQAAENNDSLYPSFRKLPTLGVSYADLFREVKLRETVFEILTQQYEMAKVEEAKEIPTAKVLDPADVPEKKSGPPRTLILIFGVFFSFVIGAVVVIGKTAWQQTDSDDPRKLFIKEIWNDTQPAYSDLQGRAQSVAMKFRRDSNSHNGHH